MSDDEDILHFGEDAEVEYGNLSGEHGEEEALGLLETYPKLGFAYEWFNGAMNRVWELAAVFQPLFKKSWVLFIIYLGITTNNRLRWINLVPLIGGAVDEDEEDMY